MPTIPTYTKCAILGCKNTKSKCNQWCMDHGGINARKFINNLTDNRKETIDRYKTKQWSTLRKIQLSKKPLCASCLSKGIVTQAHHVDHVFPWSQIGTHAFTRNIYQSLCAPCHSVKTSYEQAGIYKLYGTHTIDYRLSDYDRVMNIAFPSV